MGNGHGVLAATGGGTSGKAGTNGKTDPMGGKSTTTVRTAVIISNHGTNSNGGQVGGPTTHTPAPALHHPFRLASTGGQMSGPGNTTVTERKFGSEHLTLGQMRGGLMTQKPAPAPPHPTRLEPTGSQRGSFNGHMTRLIRTTPTGHRQRRGTALGRHGKVTTIGTTTNIGLPLRHRHRLQWKTTAATPTGPTMHRRALHPALFSRRPRPLPLPPPTTRMVPLLSRVLPQRRRRHQRQRTWQ